MVLIKQAIVKQRSSKQYVGLLVLVLLVCIAISSLWCAMDQGRMQQEYQQQLDFLRLQLRQRNSDSTGIKPMKGFKDFETNPSIDRKQLSVQLVCNPKDDWNPHRHSSKPYKAPTEVPSIFNCQHPLTGGRCRYFYPSNFFDPLCGLGKDYTYMVIQAEDQLRKRKLWNGASPRMGLPHFTFNFKIRDGRRIMVPGKPNLEVQNSTISESSNTERLYLERLSYLHVHKAGGTSVKKFQSDLFRSGFGDLTNAPWFHPKDPTQIPYPGNYTKALHILDQACRYPQTWFSNVTENPEKKNKLQDQPQKSQISEPVLLYTFVRDPASRFISAIGQVMGGMGSRGNFAKKFRTACLKPTARETIACCINYVKEQSIVAFDVHFAPQAIDIAFTTIWQDVPVAVFSMEQSLLTVMQELSQREVLPGQPSIDRRAQQPRVQQRRMIQRQGILLGQQSVDSRRQQPRTQRRRLGNSNHTNMRYEMEQLTKARTVSFSHDHVTTTTVIPNLRNGSREGYRPDPVLTRMSVNDYNSTLLESVCEMYKVDVLLLNSLGYSTSCDHIESGT